MIMIDSCGTVHCGTIHCLTGFKITWHRCKHWRDGVSHGRITLGRHRGQRSKLVFYGCQGNTQTLQLQLYTAKSQYWLQWTRQFRVIDSSGSPSLKHFCFSRMSKYTDLLIIQSFSQIYYLHEICCWLSNFDLLMTWSRNAWLHRFHGKWKYQYKVYIPLLKHSFKAIISAKRVLFTYRFVENLPLTNVL